MRLNSPAFRAEAAANLRLALPVIAAQTAGVGMGAIDAIYAGRLGPEALAAVAVGVNINNLFLIFFMGLMMACSPIIAHMVGAGRGADDIGRFMRRARRFALGAGVLWMLLLNLIAPPILRVLNLADETVAEAIAFERWLSFSAIGTTLWFCLRFCAEGVAQVRPIVIASIVGLCGNIVFGWLFVFGNLGLPRLGVIGCGLATTLSTLLMALTLDGLYRRVPALRVYRGAGVRTTAAPEGARDILRLGVPIALILVAEGGLFVLTAMLMARFGDHAVAAYQVAINFASLAFMIPLGIGMATTVRVGLAAGAGQHDQARYRGLVGLALGALNAASNAALMAIFPLTIAGFYSRDAEIIRQAGAFIVLAAGFQLFDGVQATANGALRGIKDTQIPIGVTLAAYWAIGMPVGLLLAFPLGYGPAGLWWGLSAGLAFAALGLSLRFATKTSKTMLLRSEPAA